MLHKVRAIFAVFALLLCASCTVEPKPAAPSILVITADDLGNQLGSYGDTTVPTPNIDALAARGTRFTRAYVTQPSCSPSRSSFLSGLYPHQNGQLGLAHMGFGMIRDWPVTPGLLREQLGYFTALAGKLHVGPNSAFQFFDIKEHEAGTLWTRDVNAVGEKAARYFQAAAGAPFYVQFDLFDPHPPFEAQVEGLPEQPLGADQVEIFSWISGAGAELETQTANYYNSVSRLDSIVGRIVEELRKAGRLENTVIVFWSDNGPAFPRAKTTLYEAGTRVPFIMAGPDIKAGQVRDELVSMVDMMPTLLQMAGAELPVVDVAYTGLDLSPLLRGEQVSWRRYLFTEQTFHTPQMWEPLSMVSGS